jgi:Transcriptional activator of glycolytic enzymes
VENQLVIDELHVAQPDGPPQPQAVGGQQIPHAQALNGHAAQLQACLNQIHHCRTEIQEIKTFHSTELALLQSWMQVKFATQVRNINRLRQSAPFAPTQHPVNNNNQQPALQEQGFGGGAGIPAGEAAAALVNKHRPARPNAVLCKGPKNIYDLWREYQHGIGNNMPAKNFNGKERGRAKSAYSRRNIVWTVIVDLVTAGFDADVVGRSCYMGAGVLPLVLGVLSIQDWYESEYARWKILHWNQ